jgi:hypothetical protein
MTVSAATRIRYSLAAALFAATLAGAAAAAPIEKSLLASDGTLHVVQAGTAADLGIAGPGLHPGDWVIEWTARRQDGTQEIGIIPGTNNRNDKRDLDLAYDEESGTLVLLWSEHFSYLNQIHLAIRRNSSWETGALSPSLGLTRAFHPKMLLSHFQARYEVEGGSTVTATRSLLSIIFWEEASTAQARYAPIFLDEELDDQDLRVYDLPALVGPLGAAASTAKYPPAAYMFPALQSEGVSGAVLANFVDLARDKEYVVKITFPENLGRPGNDNLTWQRRRIPVVGVMGSGPVSNAPEMQDISMESVIGAGYKPTHFWRDRDAVKYTRFDGREWSSPRSIPLTEQLTYERAVRLIEEMARRN